MSQDNSNDQILWFVAGAAVGASVALLFAPASGEHTRKQLVRKAGEGHKAITESGREMINRGQDMLDKARGLTDQATEMFEKGRKLVENTAANLQS